jgi:hypothetical protein
MASPACNPDTLAATNTRPNTKPSIEREDRHGCFMARTSRAAGYLLRAIGLIVCWGCLLVKR